MNEWGGGEICLLLQAEIKIRLCIEMILLVDSGHTAAADYNVKLLA